MRFNWTDTAAGVRMAKTLVQLQPATRYLFLRYHAVGKVLVRGLTLKACAMRCCS
jgi:hypothetical protein